MGITGERRVVLVMPEALDRDGSKNAGPGAREARLPAFFVGWLLAAFVVGAVYAALVW